MPWEEGLMDRVQVRQPEYETWWMQAYREELRERIAQVLDVDGSIQPLSGLHLYRGSEPKGPVYSVTMPSFCVIAQGSKQILVGDSTYQYDPYHYLLATIEIPSVAHVIEASPTQPYLSLRLDLTATLVSSVIAEIGEAEVPDCADSRAIDVSPLDANLLDATVRLMRLLDSPDEARILLPLISREIVYRLLLSKQGSRLRHLVMLGGYTPDIARAVARLRQDFDQPLRVEDLARELGMSVSGFHYHFKAVTAMSPLQFQKRLRLQEARRLMLSEDLDVTSAAFRVGYNDPSHFSREYKSLFGIPPLRDVQRLRETASALYG